MKLFRLLFTLMVVAFVSMAANAAVTVQLYGTPGSYFVNQMYPTQTLTPDADGFLQFKGAAMTYGRIYAAEGYKLIGVTNRETGADVNITTDSDGVRCCYVGYSTGNQTVQLNVTSVAESEVPEIKFTISAEGSNVDKISMISTRTHTGVKVSTTPTTVTVEKGDRFQIRPTVENTYFYQLQVNGVPQPGDGYSTWYYTPADGDVVVILTDFPDQEVPFVVLLTGEDMDLDVVKSFEIDGVKISPEVWYVDEEKFENEDYFCVRYGKFVTITLNTTDYSNFDIQINGKPYALQYGDPIIDIMVTEETGYGIYIDAQKTSVGVNSISQEMTSDSRIFNLQGMEVKASNLPSGIYIKGGKLVKIK